MFKALSNNIRIHILKTLIFRENVSFSKLVPADLNSTSQFNYHLKWLLNKGFVIKKDEHYFLGPEGKKLSVFLSAGMNIEAQPIIVVNVAIKNKDKYLMSRSKKEPFKNFWSISCFGKIEYGESIETFAKKMTLQKTGCSIDALKLKGVFSVLTYSKGTIAYHHMHYLFMADEFKGTLNEESTDRINAWVREKDILKQDVFPNIELFLKTLKSNKIKVYELKVELSDVKTCEILNEF